MVQMSWLLLILSATLVRCEEFVLGYLTGSKRLPGNSEYSRPGLTISGAISLAVNEVNNGLLGSRGHRLTFEIAETYGDEVISIKQTASLWTQNISAYIGPQETCVHEGRMAAAFNLPMISYFCTDNETSNKNFFPTFARTRPPDAQISKSVASVLLTFNWTQVAFFYQDSSSSEFQKIASTIISTLEAHGIVVRFRRSWSEIYYFHKFFKGPFYKLLEETYRDIRIYVILGNHDEHMGLMVAMEEMELFENGEYWVVGVDIKQYEQDQPEKYLQGEVSDITEPVTISAFRSYFGVLPTPPIGYKNFSVAVNSYLELPPFKFPNPISQMGGKKKIPKEAAYLYDAVHLYARALVYVLDAGDDPNNGTAIINAIRGKHYKSAMGYLVYMDENGDAEGNYTLLSRQVHQNLEGQYGLYPTGVFTVPGDGSRLPELRITASIDWINGKPPIAEPPCGFRGEKCVTYTAEIAGGIAGSMIFVMAVVMLWLYRNWRYEQELDSLLWKVDYKDIQMNEDNNGNTSLGTKISRAIHPLIRTSQVSLSSNPDSDFRYSTIYTQIGVYKGRILAIKKVHKKSIDITRSMKKELKMMRDLRHDNLNAFIGACTDPPNICIVTEYCTRGSLKDILENEDVKLDNMFIASLVGDIIRGMMYLHDSPVRFHGNLKTSNCLVDSRWVVKIADFGLHEFTTSDNGVIFECPLQNECRAQRALEGLLYKAPELLRASNISSIDTRGTQKGDIYSFGIILYELHARHGPFGDSGMSANEILDRVIHVQQGIPPFRPPLELLETSFTFVRECLVECWAECPEERPDFKTVRTKLRPLRKGMKPNIFDNMMAMMEKYANNLEALVDERTDQLVEEKKKTEALLYEMLPRSVAEQLKRGNKVEAESFDCVTIYFSDIVGFTSMSAESTPLQVVDFLNDLYTCFDSIIENYDVYKVETIGDAYMVVSGLPIRNGNIHAAEIASMSLYLLDAVKMFRIRHRPTDNLRLRIGIHSGPVCAGVVGLKMPRYCLFGDTVNTTSRMESSGVALKIHCSLECKTILDTLGGYKLIERGMVEMKGKGEKLTFWLVDEDPGKRELRNEERELRRCKSTGKKSKMDSNGYPCGVPRSSLKNKCNNIMPRSPLARCSSLESPKRLRFASGDLLEPHPGQQHRVSRDPLLDVITDDSPCKKKSPDEQIDTSVSPDCNLNIRKNSNSCPCIENISSDSFVQHSQRCLSRFEEDKNSSAPLLNINLVSSLGTDKMSSKNKMTMQCNGGTIIKVTSSLKNEYGDVFCDDVKAPLLIKSTSENDVTDRETPV